MSQSPECFRVDYSMYPDKNRSESYSLSTIHSSPLKILIILGLVFLIGTQGCTNTKDKIGLFFEKPAIKKAAQKYLDAEIRRDHKCIYGCLAPSSVYCSTHSYEEYLEEATSSPVRIIGYNILNIHHLTDNLNKEKDPSVEKFVQVEVDVTLFYNDIKKSAPVNYDFTFIKEGGKWYKG
ncbi:MAG: hypothetical protein J7L53_09850 [Deltaproteobacteria bacterium]|nr:hypothetical protein [Deltaproteobacteria bacterium]